MKHILTVVSEHGYWGKELVGPKEVLYGSGYTMTIATPTGKRPRALPPSMDPTYVDPPLGRPVTTEEDARAVPWGGPAAPGGWTAVHRRYEAVAVILTTNRPVEDWGHPLRDTAAGAIPDRFLHHAEVFRLQGRSRRVYERQQRLRQATTDADPPLPPPTP